MSDEQSTRARSVIMREDESGLFVRVRAGLLRFHPWGARQIHAGDRVRVRINYLPAEDGRYGSIPAARCYQVDEYRGYFSWEQVKP